jgi:hypothetical protein
MIYVCYRFSKHVLWTVLSVNEHSSYCCRLWLEKQKCVEYTISICGSEVLIGATVFPRINYRIPHLESNHNLLKIIFSPKPHLC